MPGVPEGLVVGDDVEPPDPPELPEPLPELPDAPELGDGLVDDEPPVPPDPPVDPLPSDGVAVGEEVEGVGVGLDDVGEEDGEEGEGLEGVDVAVTGGKTPGGTLEPAARSCCHDQPTDPPAGTVNEPTPEDE